MRILADALAAGQTGLVARLEALVDRFNLNSRTMINVQDEEYGAVGDGVATDGPAIAAAYADAVAQGGGTLVIPKGTYKYTADLNWTSNLVSVIGAGSSAVTLQASGTAKIVIRPSVFTITQGPKIAGFTVKGDASAPADATGIYSGGITGSEWDDVVVTGFKGTGSIGIHLQNAGAVNWTERNEFRRVWVDDNTIGIKCSMDAAAVTNNMNSFGYNRWLDVRFNANTGQIGFQAVNAALLYNNTYNFLANLGGTAPIIIDISGTAALSGWMILQAEQTSGTGGIGVRTSGSGVFACNGLRNYTGTLPEDVGGGLDDFTLTGALRMRELAANSRMGAVALVGGTATVDTSATKGAGAGQRILLTRQAGGGVRGHLEIFTRTAGVSFVIRSLDPAGALVADTSVVSWMIVERYT